MRFQEITFCSPMKRNILVDTEVTNCLGSKSIFGYAWVIIIFVSLGLATWRVCQTQRTCGCTETQRPSLWFRTTLGRVVRGLRSPRDMVSGAVTDRHRLTLLFFTIELLYFSPQNSRWNSYVYEWTRLIYGLNVLCLHFVWFLCKYMCVTLVTIPLQISSLFLNGIELQSTGSLSAASLLALAGCGLPTEAQPCADSPGLCTLHSCTGRRSSSVVTSILSSEREL